MDKNEFLGTRAHLILRDDAVRLRRLSPRNHNLLLVGAALDGVQGDDAGHCRGGDNPQISDTDE